MQTIGCKVINIAQLCPRPFLRQPYYNGKQLQTKGEFCVNCEIQYNGSLFAKLEDIWPCVWNSIEYICMHVFLMT